MDIREFDIALWCAKRSNMVGAEELFSLYQSLSDDAEGEALMAKLDAYVSDYPEAEKLYLSIHRQA